jgi:hypothetical protein
LGIHLEAFPSIIAAQEVQLSNNDQLPANHEIEHNSSFFLLSSRPVDLLTRYLSGKKPTMPTTTAETISLVNRNVSVAPLVLLSVVDHYNRAEVKSSKSKRVVGVLLGQNDGKNVRVSNSFAGMPLLSSFLPSS